MRMRPALAAAIVVAAGCVTVTPEMRNVRVTNNPDVVRGCKFLGNTAPIKDTEWSRSGSLDNDTVFRDQVVKKGGNVGYITAQPQKPAEGVGYYGEAYLCEQPRPEQSKPEQPKQ
jgi:hypothetical protein